MGKRRRHNAAVVRHELIVALVDANGWKAAVAEAQRKVVAAGDQDHD